MINKHNEPPIGIEPGSIVYFDRISKLAKAIDRYVGIEQTRSIHKWATEIILLCDLIDSVEPAFFYNTKRENDGECEDPDYVHD